MPIKQYILIASMLLFGSVTLPVWAGDLPDEEEGVVNLVNATGHDIESILIEAGNAPEGAEYWSDELLEEGVIFEDGESLELHYPKDVSIDDESLYDLAAQWDSAEDAEENETKVWFKLDLDNASDITLHYDEETDETSSDQTHAH